jgi:SAM-dependent methyltransferase
MTAPLGQHQREIEQNLEAWRNKPLLQKIYATFYARIVGLIDQTIPGRVVEIGSGIGNLQAHVPGAIRTDLFPNPWLDLVCDGYELPFASGSLSHLILFDVFHHLEAPAAFLSEAHRVLVDRGRLVVFEPFISTASLPIYGLLHREPVSLRERIVLSEMPPAARSYYAAQGNATRLFFRNEAPGWAAGWEPFHIEAFSCLGYLFSGGYSKPALYPTSALSVFDAADRFLSRWPRTWAGRCLVGLMRSGRCR